MLGEDWTVGNSYIMPTPASETLADLIQDLTQELSAAAETPTQPIVDIASVEVALPESDSQPEASIAVSAAAAATYETANPTAPTDSSIVLVEPPEVRRDADPDARDRWFLGLDLGTTGISAVLLNPAQAQLYPLYWQVTDSANFAAQKQFRLSTAVTLFAAEPAASPLPTIRLQPHIGDAQLCLQDWKPFLGVAVPHYSPQTSGWEPQLQWSTQQTLPLRTFQEALQQLLTTLNPDRASFIPLLTCGALGLDPEKFQTILRQLDGVIVGYPSNWSDTYSLNVREAILQAELVQQPDQITFIEDAIAALLSALPASDGRSVTLAQNQGKNSHLHNAHWQGMTLILTAGASLSELALVNLPTQLATLNHTDFQIRSLPLAGQTIDQDILCQLLYPALVHLSAESSATAEPATAPDYVLASIDLQSLQLDSLDLPNPAELSWPKRWQLQQRLANAPSGQPLLMAARSLKISLQQQPEFVLKYGEHTLKFTRQQLTSQAILPYVQRLNRELNTLLAQTNTTAAAIKQVVCTGGTASLSAIARWLRQKLPNATIVQDTYARPMSPTLTLASCSRVAYGLATVPLHSQVIDSARHQFSDYFLLRSLLQIFPAKPVPLETILQLLEQQGIDTQTCRSRILALLEGHLPPGLIPEAANLPLLRPESAKNPDYAAIRLTPLFVQLADRTYEANHHSLEYVQQYLETLCGDMDQLLDRPLSLEMGLDTGNLRSNYSN